MTEYERFKAWAIKEGFAIYRRNGIFRWKDDGAKDKQQRAAWAAWLARDELNEPPEVMPPGEGDRMKAIANQLAEALDQLLSADTTHASPGWVEMTVPKADTKWARTALDAYRKEFKK